MRTVKNKFNENWNFNEYLLLGWSESHISLTFQWFMTSTPYNQQIYVFFYRCRVRGGGAGSECWRFPYFLLTHLLMLVNPICLLTLHIYSMYMYYMYHTSHCNHTHVLYIVYNVHLLSFIPTYTVQYIAHCTMPQLGNQVISPRERVNGPNA